MCDIRFAVAGATGRLGCHLVAAPAERGHWVVLMSRANGVDIVTGGAKGGCLPSPHAKLAGPTVQERLDAQPLPLFQTPSQFRRDSPGPPPWVSLIPAVIRLWCEQDTQANGLRVGGQRVVGR
ncbi:hypothetical protein [Kibdelosporangium phytohabitans]|uniref:NAD-dependent epimerase/dehydratase domain-containing protein n=1 Tax=Kibdelosporangium phytohabitans TaxID=860235 RepID=A0A0N7F445_9PSEU|nr:hypothetical protein [Kibdelosporangium phytohabitans]ALG10407.1 hypothetical protein AOZ06_29080 [Kibdelosporangium phytohabitans]MBE1461469.1 hypothetical protein [Kibdelosporangium phytohabitans]